VPESVRADVLLAVAEARRLDEEEASELLCDDERRSVFEEELRVALRAESRKGGSLISMQANARNKPPLQQKLITKQNEFKR